MELLKLPNAQFVWKIIMKVTVKVTRWWDCFSFDIMIHSIFKLVIYAVCNKLSSAGPVPPYGKIVNKLLNFVLDEVAVGIPLHPASYLGIH